MEFLYLFTFCSVFLYGIIEFGYGFDRDAKLFNKNVLQYRRKSIFIKYCKFDVHEYLISGYKKNSEKNIKHISKTTIIVDVIGYVLYIICIISLLVRVFNQGDVVKQISAAAFIMFNTYWIALLLILTIIHAKHNFPFMKK